MKFMLLNKTMIWKAIDAESVINFVFTISRIKKITQFYQIRLNL